MTKINTQIKTQELVDIQAQEIPEQDAPVVNEAAQELKIDIEGALADIEQFKEENSEWLSEENYNELDRIESTLKAESVAIDAYPYLNGGSGAVPGQIDPTAWELPQELDPLWNGIPADHINKFGEDEGRLHEDTSKYGEYMGTVEIPNSGDISTPTNIGFQMTEDMDALYAESRGRDVILTAEYSDGSRKSWVIRDGSVRTEPLILSGIGLSHGVTIDCHRVYRHGGQPLYIHGTEYNDIIKGTQGDDGIIGYAGDDEIFAGAGDDRVYADEGYEFSGQFDPAYGGNDIIHGGAGNDILYGGGGLDTHFTSDANESISEFERTEDDKSIAPPDSSQWFNSNVWELAEDLDDGMLVFQNQGDGKGGEIDISLGNMPGYNMAYGDMDADGSLIITFVGDEGMFKIKLEDFFNEQFGTDDPSQRVVHLNMHGTGDSDIMHFANVEVTSQVINILGGSGEDIILGAQNQLLSDGIDPTKLKKSQKNGSGVLQGCVNSGIFAANEEHPYSEDGNLDSWCGYKAEVEDGQIVIKDSGNSDEKVDILSLKAPKGYTHGYITSDEQTGDIYVIMVKPTASGDAKTVVVKIDASLGLGYDDILIKNEFTNTTSEVDGTEYQDLGAPFTLTAISLDENDYVIDGQAGEDLIFAPEGTKVMDDPKEVVWQETEMAWSPMPEYNNDLASDEPAISGDDASEGEVDETQE